MRMKACSAVAFAIALAGCATPYERNGAMGGFDEVRVSESVYRVSVQGNANTSSERAEQIMLLRAAELTIQNGYTHYVVEGRETAKDTQHHYIGYGAYGQFDYPRGSYVIRMMNGPNLPPSAYDARIIEADLKPRLTN